MSDWISDKERRPEKDQTESGRNSVALGCITEAQRSTPGAAKACVPLPDDFEKRCNSSVRDMKDRRAQIGVLFHALNDIQETSLLGVEVMSPITRRAHDEAVESALRILLTERIVALESHNG